MKKDVKRKTLKGAILKTLLLFLFLGIILFSLVYFEIISIKSSTIGDLVVTLHASKESLSLDTGSSDNVTFSMNAISRIDCVTQCNISFSDKSSGVIIDQYVVYFNNSFQQLSKTYELSSPTFGEGQKIFSFNALCQNVYSDKCAYNNTIVDKTSIVTMSYLLPPSLQTLKPELRQKLEDLLNNYSAQDEKYRSLKISLSLLGIQNSSADMEFLASSKNISSLVNLWNSQDYPTLNSEIENFTLENLSTSIDSAFSPIRQFNSIVISSTQIQTELPIVLGLSKSFGIKEKLLKEFNSLIDSLTKKSPGDAAAYETVFNSSYSVIYDNLSSSLDSMILSDNLTSNASSISGKFSLLRSYCSSNNSSDCAIILNVSVINLPRANISVIPEDFNLSLTKFDLSENPPICCVFGKCAACCLNLSCSFTPVILVHGHLFNVQNSPDYSVSEFELLQNELEKGGYINAGTITPDSSYSEVSDGEWGIAGNSLSVSATYYRENEKNLTISQYASILKSEIDLIKYRTGQQKVDIIAHSMGGLVVRKYIETYGEDSVNKFIMIAVPNNGTSGIASSLCPLFGSQKECDDMQTGSQFLSNLSLYNPQTIKLYNILGSGCKMSGGEDGDGIVTVKSATLVDQIDPVTTFTISGTCPSVSDVLHTSILSVQKHPETVQKIIDILKQ